MPKAGIETKTNNTTDANDWEQVTGTDNGSGKRSLDVNITGGTVTVDSELPAAVLSADNLANPTAPQVLSHNMIYDAVGDNWDRAQAGQLHDLDSDGGTSELNFGVSLRTTASGGSAEAGVEDNPLVVAQALVPTEYDYIALTYVAAGNGAGEIETVTYKEGGAAGTTVATLTLAYDGSDRLSSVTRS